MFLGKERGMDFHVYADETRPLLQGARLTAYELQKAGIDVTLICDKHGEHCHEERIGFRRAWSDATGWPLTATRQIR